MLNNKIYQLDNNTPESCQPFLLVNSSEIENFVNKPKDEKPSKTKLNLARMVLVYFGIEVLFSIEVALTVPILLKLKVSEKLYSYVYFFSPLIAFFFQPILGSLSDRCDSRFGRRKPFIFVLSILAFTGISLILNGQLIGKILGDANFYIPFYGITLTTIGVTILDFSADSCDCPLRAYLLDNCNSSDKDTGLNIHAFLGGIGAALGYILTSIDWNKTYLGLYLEENQILFIFSATIFSLCLLSTMTSAKEEKIKISNEIKNYSIYEEIKMLFKSFLGIPKQLSRLLLAQLIGWLAFFSTTLFFTDFIAQVVYNGDPNSDPDSEKFAGYNHGIKMGSYCLLSYSISSALSALLMEKYLLNKFSTKSIFIGTYLFYMISCIGIYFSKDIFIINILCISFGFLLTTITTLPYQMIYDFNQDELYLNNGSSKTKRGIGIDCSLLSSCYFLSQTIISSFMSFFIYYFGNRVILIFGIVFSIMGIFCSSYIAIYPENEKSKQIKKIESFY